MKKHFLFGAALTVLLFAGCETKTSLPTPVLTVEPGTSTFTSVEFVISSENADKVNYLLIEQDDEIPEIAVLLDQGVEINGNTEEVVEISDLESATDYVVVAVASNAEKVSELAVLNLSTMSDLFADVQVKYTDALWMGPVEDAEVDRFCLQLSSAKFDETLMPQENGDFVRLYFNTPHVEDESVLAIAPGTYVLGKENENLPFTIDLLSSIYAMGNDEVEWMQINFESAEVTVENNSDQYVIKANLVILDGEGSKVRVKYSGEIEIVDYSDGFRHFNAAQNETMTGMTGAVFSSTAEGLDNYTLTLYNCPLDEDGFIIGSGYVFNSELYAESVPYEEYDFAGTYTENSDWDMGQYPENTYITGFVYDYYGMKMPVGTYLAEYNDAGVLVSAGLIAEGEIHVSRSNGNCVVNADLITDKGVSVKIAYDGPDVPLANYKSSANMSRQLVKSKGVQSIQSFVNVM